MLKLSNGDMFEGIWSQDERCGFGIMKFSSGEEYKGGWQSNTFHGGMLSYFCFGVSCFLLLCRISELNSIFRQRHFKARQR